VHYAGEHSYFQDAYQPSDLRSMLRDYTHREGGRGYNEIIVSEQTWQSHLPSSFDAFFYPDTASCRASGCERKTREAYRAFREDYPASGVLLLTIDPMNWEAPFGVAPAASE
jgi:hypothetical protein